MTSDRHKRLHFRAWHRGTREADYMIGCFFDRYGAGWNEAELVWFEKLIDEEDVDDTDDSDWPAIVTSS